MSGKYLLLRDNKQSGPFTLDEIKVMGLKKYDLIWIDGKSAAWRYPCEVDEFKSFAPQVDEQPYDRFYKKPVQQEHLQLQKAETMHKAEDKPKEEAKKAAMRPAAEEKKIAPRKYVSISLPGSYRVKIDPARPEPVSGQSQKTEPERPVSKDIEETEKPALAPIFAASEPVTIPVIQHTDFRDLPEEAPAVFPKRQGLNRNDLIQYTALGLGVLTIIMVVFLMVSGILDPVATPPPSKPVVQKQATPLPQAEAATPTPEETGTPEESLPADPTPVQTRETTGEGSLNTLPVKKTTVVRFNNDQPASAGTEQRNPVIHSLSSKVDLSLNKYKVGMFGGIDDIKVSIQNHSAYPLDLVVVELQYIQNNEKLFRTETLRFKDVGAGDVQVLAAPRSSKGIKLKAKISYITSSVAGVSENL